MAASEAEGQSQISPNEVVAEVVKSPTFLSVAGIKTTSKETSTSAALTQVYFDWMLS